MIFVDNCLNSRCLICGFVKGFSVVEEGLNPVQYVIVVSIGPLDGSGPLYLQSARTKRGSLFAPHPAVQMRSMEGSSRMSQMVNV